MRRVLRQDPDVIFVGEMRDPETVWAALAAAETGHLVLSTLHTTDAIETINRIIDFFPPLQQKQVRLSLATSLRGVVSASACSSGPTATGRVPAVEVLVSTPAGCSTGSSTPSRPTTIEEIIADGEYYGMQTFDQSLFSLYKDGLVDARATRWPRRRNPHDLRIALAAGRPRAAAVSEQPGTAGAPADRRGPAAAAGYPGRP